MLFWQGFTMGLAYVAPIGLQNLFLIRMSLAMRFVQVVKLIAVLLFFDILLSAACFYGIGALLDHWAWLQLIILGGGSLLVLYIGQGLLRSSTTVDIEASRERTTWVKLIYTAAVVTWCNPQAILDGTMVLGAFRSTMGTGEGQLFISGVWVASAVWFTVLGLGTFWFRNFITGRLLMWVNRLCGAVIVFYGLKLGVEFVNRLLGN